MPTLDELLGQSPVSPDTTNTLDDYFDTSSIGPSVPDFTIFDEDIDTPFGLEERGPRNAILDFLGQGLWSFLDVGAFGVPSLVAPKEIEESYLTPTTGAGRVGAAIGGTIGFVAGGPMKLGAKAVSTVARPFIKAAGKQTVKQIVKKTAKEITETAAREGLFTTKVATNIMNKEVGKRLSYLTHKSRWDRAGKGVAENWGKSASKAIDDITNEAIRLEQLTVKEAQLLSSTFKKNIGTRPMQDFVDLIMRRHPNKWGFIAGSMVQEGIMFGMIDAVMEVSHSLNEGRSYDLMQPLWGVGIGAGFGALKLLPAAGKQSITGEDFRAGARSIMFKDHFKKMGHDKLVNNAHIIGKSRMLNGESSVIEFRGRSIDLLNPISSIGKGKAEGEIILKKALNSERVKYGKQMMAASVSEDFKSTLANWKRVIGGTAIMNARMVMQMSQGAEMEPEDIATSLLIGAWLNRRGRPLTPEMNMKKMGEIRRNLHVLGEPQTRMYDVFPTLGRSQFEYINPLTSEGFKGIRKKAEDLDLVGETPEQVERMRNDGSPSLASTEKSFPLFDEYYNWLSGASGKRYIKPKALITEKEAAEVEDAIRTLDFDGKKVNTVQDFEDMMIASTERITDTVEYEIAKTLHDALQKSTGLPINNPSHGSLGDLPESVIITQNLRNAVERGEIKYAGDEAPVSVERMHESLRKLNKLIEINDNIMKGQITDNPNLKIAEIKTADQLRELMDTIEAGESRINQMFGTSKELLKFDFDALDTMQEQLLARYMNKGIDKLSKFFSDTDNPKWGEVLNVLQDAGIVTKDPENIGQFRIYDFSKIKIQKEEGFKGDAEESLVKTVIGILGAKGNKSLSVDASPGDVIITQEQVGRLESYLNQNKIVTQKELLDMFRVNITQKIFSDLMKDTKIDNRDISILGDLAGLGVPFAKYSTMADGGVGYTISPIDAIGVKTGYYGKWIKEYNDYIGYDPNNPGTPIKGSLVNRGKGFVKFDRTIQMLDKNDIRVLRSIVRRKGAEEGQRAVETVVDFVKALDPQDNLKAGIIKYLEKADNPDDMLNFMLGEGLITTKSKKGVIDYVFNHKEFSSDVSRKKVQDWLSRFGVHTDDIQKMMSAAEVEIDSYINNKHGGHRSTFTQQSFFSKYFPDKSGLGSRFNEASEQDVILNKAIYETNGDLTASPHDNILLKMVVNGVEGKDILANRRGIHRESYEKISDDIQKMLILRHGTVSKPVLSVTQGKVKTTMKNMQEGPFTKLLDDMEIPYVFVDGEMYSFHYADRDIKSRSINVLDMDSPHSIPGFNKDAPSVASNLRQAFDRILNTYQFEGGAGEGVALIRVGNAKHVMAVPKTSFEKVNDLFNTRIFDQYYERATGDVKDRLESMRSSLEKAGDWSEVHVDAMRSLIVNEMTKGKNDVRFLDMVAGTGEELANLGKRFSLYHTPSFKRLNRGIIDKLIHNVNRPEDIQTLANFSARDVGFIVWNDKGMAGIKDRVQSKLAAKKTSWEEMLGARGDESGFDSIAFISKDFQRVLELYYGVSKRGSNVFKPIISSNGDEYLMFAKTVFVHDPDIQADIFSKKQGLDILLTRTADKMKSSMSESEWAEAGQPDRPIYIDKTVDEMMNITSQEITQKMKTIPMDKIGVSVIPETEMRARQSYSIPNYMNMEESGEYYRAFYSERLDKLLGVNQTSPGVMEKLTRNSMYKRIALLKLKNINPDITLADMQSSPEGLEGIGHQLMWAALGGDPRAMGEHVLVNTIKSQFLDPILSPLSQTDDGSVYGGKAVIKQNFKFRDLDPTIRTGEKEDTKIYQGEIVLPYNARSGSIDFRGKDLILKAVDKKGNSKDLKSVFKELLKEQDPTLKDADFEKDYNWMLENGALGELHDLLKGLNPDWSIGVLTTRYPRTTPNDLAVLRLAGFLKENEGNTVIANDFDVLNIFEGDYDVDEIDFFWAMNKGTWGHVDKQKQHWVNTVNPDHYKPQTPDLRLIDNGASNAAWNTFDANNRVFKRGIGVVQKTVRLTNHVANLGIKNPDTGMKDLMKYKIGDREFTVSVDYDNTSFFERTALESQLIIDYWKGVSPDIVNNIPGYRNDYLFQTMDRSIGKEEVSSLRERQQSHLAKGPENKRIRIFRKFDKEGNEVDLSAIDKTMIQTLMQEHSKLLTLSTEVYDGSGQSKPATYNDIINISRNYFDGHMSDISKNVFLAARRKHGKTEEFEQMFGLDFQVRAASRKNLEKYTDDTKEGGKLWKTDLMNEIQNEIRNKTLAGKHTYGWYSKSPFVDGAITNGQETQRSGGAHGSVVERIYREILHRDPLSEDGRGGKSDVVLQGELYNEMQSAATEIMSEHSTFGNNPVEVMKSILPELIKNVNQDVKTIKYYKKIIAGLVKNKDLPDKTKTKRMDALNEIIKEREAQLKDFLTTEYLDTGQSKFLNTLKMADITREKDMEEGTIQWYTLYDMVERYRPDMNIKQFSAAVNNMRKMGAELYSEYNDLGSSTPYRNMSLLKSEAALKRQDPNESIKDVEAKLMEELDVNFNEFGMPFLFEYAMPVRDDGTVIGIFNGNPMPVSTKPSGRFKRVLRFLFDKHNTVQNKQEKQAIREVLESLAQRYTAYRNFFDQNYGLIPLKDQGVMDVINNVPGFNRKLKGTFDRYETIGIDKGVFSRDMFGMGPEYDSNVSFYRRLIGDAFGSNTEMRFKDLESSLSYTNQLVMENNYMNPVSYFLMTEKIRTDLADMGLDKAAQTGLEGQHGNKLSSHATSPELAMLAGRADGVSIKPMALLSSYRLNMLKKMIKQGKEIKIDQKRSQDWEQYEKEYEKTGYCKDSVY